GGTRAEVARHERGVERATAVRAEAAGVSQAIRLRMRDGIAVLHAFVVTDTDELPLLYQRGADGNSAFLQSFQRLLQRGDHELVADRRQLLLGRWSALGRLLFRRWRRLLLRGYERLFRFGRLLEKGVIDPDDAPIREI